jgi:flavin reductase (DIM6/NTAB) family NADH-FMN oxidoreductase RutF
MRTRVFSINVLSEGQEEISRFFAGPQGDSSWFDELHCREGNLGAPLIPDCLAHIECELVTSHEAGDHTILIAEVQYAEIALNDRPLLLARLPRQCPNHSNLERSVITRTCCPRLRTAFA